MAERRTAYCTGRHTIRVGQHYRTTGDSNVRTLRVEALEVRRAHDGKTWCRVDLTVIREEHEGTVTEPMRRTSIEAMRLTSRAYALVQEAANAA